LPGCTTNYQVTNPPPEQVLEKHIVITSISSLLTYDEYTIIKILKWDNSCEFEFLFKYSWDSTPEK